MTYKTSNTVTGSICEQAVKLYVRQLNSSMAGLRCRVDRAQGAGRDKVEIDWTFFSEDAGHSDFEELGDEGDGHDAVTLVVDHYLPTIAHLGSNQESARRYLERSRDGTTRVS